MSLEAPPWVGRAIRGVWRSVEDIVGRDMMPRVKDDFGCGHYGCVMPTMRASDTVVKLTSDVTEGFFVAHLLDKDLQPETGLVHYDRIIGVPGSYYGRPLFLIWRDEAFDIGIVHEVASPWSRSRKVEPWKQRAYQEGLRYMALFYSAASDARDKITNLVKKHTGSRLGYGPGRDVIYGPIWDAWSKSRGWYTDIDWNEPTGSTTFVHRNQATRILRRYRGFDRIKVALDICRQSSEMLANTDQWYTIGNALSDLLDAGFILADVHGDNMGLDADDNLIITDPGHVQPFNPSLAAPPPLEILQ